MIGSSSIGDYDIGGIVLIVIESIIESIPVEYYVSSISGLSSAESISDFGGKGVIDGI